MAKEETMKILGIYLITMFFLNSVGISQTELNREGKSNIPVEGTIGKRSYEGILFHNEYPKNFIGSKNRWNPTIEDIKIAEESIENFIKKISKKNLINQGGNCPIIHENLEKYLRQYMGVINEKGEKIIVINCFWKDRKEELIGNWEEDWITVFDGCSFYWEISVNLNKNKCFDYLVNGRA